MVKYHCRSLNYTPKSQLTGTIPCIGISLKLKSKNFMDFHNENLEDLHSTQNALISSLFKLEKCSFLLNGSKFRQKLIGNVLSKPGRQKCV